MTLESYIAQLRHLNVNRRHGRASPHKPCMVLAVLDLAEAGRLANNRITFTPELAERFADFFEVVREAGDHPHAIYPFFHLRRDGFWHLVAAAGRERILAALSTVRRLSDVIDNIDHVRLDEQLHALVLDTKARTALREAIIDTWFPDWRTALHDRIEQCRVANSYQKWLESLAPMPDESPDPPSAPMRSMAFRRVVVHAYDYRCAASGWRMLTDGGVSLVEAAHLIPFRESRDDDPRNGIALTPTYHWLMDHHLIAPGTDHCWHVSKAIDKRIADHQPIIALQGTPILLPRDQRRHPKEEALAWRFAQLRT